MRSSIAYARLAALLLCLAGGFGLTLVSALPAQSTEETAPCMFITMAYDEMGGHVEFVYDLVQTGGCGAPPMIHVVASMCKAGAFSGSEWRNRWFQLDWNHKFQQVAFGKEGVADDDSIPWLANVRASGFGRDGSFTGSVTILDQMAGNTAATFVAAWGGPTWSPLGCGVDWPGVRALTVFDNRLHRGREFSHGRGERCAIYRRLGWIRLAAARVRLVDRSLEPRRI